MTAITDRPTDYYALWDSYRAGIQPDQYVPQEVKQPVEFPKGIIQNFPRDVLVRYAGMPLISKYSKPSPAAFSSANPQDVKFVFNRRVQAHLGLLPLAVC